MALVSTLLFLMVGCDQATKVIARDALDESGPLSYLSGTIRLQLVENPGAFLSLGAGLSESMRFWIFSVAVAVFLAASLWTVFRRNDLDRFTTIGITLMVAGGVGNLIDRLARGTVTDFLNLGVGSLRTGIFNVADIAIVVGCILMILSTFRDSRVRSQKA
jgi:signal peptidase II